MLSRALAPRGLRLTDLDAVLVTHEHDDHVRGLAALRAVGRPVIATHGTATALGLTGDDGARVSYGDSFEIAGLSATVFGTSHDAAEPCGYSITDGRHRVTVMTDLGAPSETCVDLVGGADLIVIESNHDVPMLRSGPYPAHLKHRVLSARGHLSNADCGAFLARCLDGSGRARTIWLAHLSATNNRPTLAVRTVERALAQHRPQHAVVALPRRDLGPAWEPRVQTGPAQLSMFE
ncbi:MAG: MBL fold metallo-hydrolase [Thermomicrobiales bacterium]|nr:MBL fold metallo-hydrolase [Thermomicrobiales bacterium]